MSLHCTRCPGTMKRGRRSRNGEHCARHCACTYTWDSWRFMGGFGEPLMAGRHGLKGCCPARRWACWGVTRKRSARRYTMFFPCPRIRGPATLARCARVGFWADQTVAETASVSIMVMIMIVRQLLARRELRDCWGRETKRSAQGTNEAQSPTAEKHHDASWRHGSPTPLSDTFDKRVSRLTCSLPCTHGTRTQQLTADRSIEGPGRGRKRATGEEKTPHGGI